MKTSTFQYLFFFLLCILFQGNLHLSAQEFRFVENKNQWPTAIRYQASLGQFSRVAFAVDGFHYAFASETAEGLDLHNVVYDKQAEPITIPFHGYRVKFLDAQTTQLRGEGRQKANYNYFLGNDSKRWASGVGAYDKVWYDDLYPGIDLEVTSDLQNLKYNFWITAGSDPAQIQWQYTGADGLSLENGQLQIETSIGQIIEAEPLAYQVVQGERRLLACSYVLEGDRVRFEFPEGYDPDWPILIDPTVVAATLIGRPGVGLATAFGHGATYDQYGNTYLYGLVYDGGFNVTTGAYDQTFNGVGDAYISKFNEDGSELIYCTYLGGEKTEFPLSLVTDHQNQVYLFTTSSSSDFPTSTDAFQTEFGGETDITISKLNADGSDLLASTFIGGSDYDAYFLTAIIGYNTYSLRSEMVIDRFGDIYIATSTNSSDFPVTNNAYDTINDEVDGSTEQDGVILKINNNLTNLKWATYLGDIGKDRIACLRVDDDLNVYVAGYTDNTTFPTTTNALQTEWNGGATDAFIAKLSSDGSTLLASTFWGTGHDDSILLMDFDQDNNIHCMGLTRGIMPISDNVYSAGINSRQFIMSLNSELNELNYSTVIGVEAMQGAFDFIPHGFMVDKCGAIYFEGFEAHEGLPVSIDGETGQDEFYVGVLSPMATDLEYATYLGNATHTDGGINHFDKNGTIYIGVCSCDDADFGVLETLPNAYADGDEQDVFCDGGIIKIDFERNIVGASGTANLINEEDSLSWQFTFTGLNADSIQWSFGDGVISSEINPQHTYPDFDNYTVQLVAWNDATCNGADTTWFNINLLPPWLVSTTEFEVRNWDIQLQPNPVQDQLTVTASGLWAERQVKATIFNTLGQQVWQQNFTASGNQLEFSVSTDTWPAGVYTLHLGNQHGQRSIQFSKY